VVAAWAGNIGGQALALGLVDEVSMDVVPVVFGKGKRYFGTVDSQQLLEDPDAVIQGDTCSMLSCMPTYSHGQGNRQCVPSRAGRRPASRKPGY
jgi:hypothetical protein